MKNALVFSELEKWTPDNKTIVLEVTKVDNSRLLIPLLSPFLGLLPCTLYLSALCINSVFKCLLSKTVGVVPA